MRTRYQIHTRQPHDDGSRACLGPLCAFECVVFRYMQMRFLCVQLATLVPLTPCAQSLKPWHLCTSSQLQLSIDKVLHFQKWLVTWGCNLRPLERSLTHRWQGLSTCENLEVSLVGLKIWRATFENMGQRYMTALFTDGLMGSGVKAISCQLIPGKHSSLRTMEMVSLKF